MGWKPPGDDVCRRHFAVNSDICGKPRSRRHLHAVCKRLQNEAIVDSRRLPGRGYTVAESAATECNDFDRLRATVSCFPDEFRFESHGTNSVDSAVDVMVAVDQSNFLHLSANFDDV